jgi:aryl-phospho-beta-D-glucosidase BglC (GH1 family)
MRIKIGVVSTRITLTLKADGQQIWEREFTPGPGEGEWEKSVYAKEWNIYQNVYNLNCFIDIPAGAKQLELTATKGDWVTIPEIGVIVGDKPEALLTLITNYGQKQNPITFADGKWSMAKEASLGRQWLWKEGIAPWIKLREQGVGIIVGEFGSYNKTPHDVVLAWLEDCLINWKEANMGWAMWNFRGSFGILDSDRQDVQYEDFNGHKLDRKMLDLLQKY